MFNIKEVLEKLEAKGAEITHGPYFDGTPGETGTWSRGTLYKFKLKGKEGFILDDLVYSRVGNTMGFVSAKYNNEWIADNFTQTGLYKICKWIEGFD
jgi:hypothetical protein